MVEIMVNLDTLKLLPCPFCGRQATIILHPGENWDGKRDKSINIGAGFGLWYVGCSYPFFEGLDGKPRCEIAPAASWFAKLEVAIVEWNTRYSQTQTL